MCSPGHIFLGVFSMIKSCGFFIVGIFSVFSRQNFVPYFYDHFHFLLGAKNSRVFLFHLIQLLIIMLILIKKFDGSYIFFEYRYIPSKTREMFFALSLLKLERFNFSVWHFYFLRKNIWQTCLFLPNSIKNKSVRIKHLGK